MDDQSEAGDPADARGDENAVASGDRPEHPESDDAEPDDATPSDERNAGEEAEGPAEPDDGDTAEPDDGDTAEPDDGDTADPGSGLDYDPDGPAEEMYATPGESTASDGGGVSSPDPDGLSGEFAAPHPSGATVAGERGWGGTADGTATGSAGTGGAAGDTGTGGAADPAPTATSGIGGSASADAEAGEWTGDADATDVPLAGDGPEYEGDEFLDGPSTDQEMPLADHIDEMMRRLTIVIGIVGVVMIVVFPIADQLINYLWNTHIPGAAAAVSERRPRLYGPLELLLTEIKVAGLAGFVIGLPVAVYQTYRFMRPGLYPNERRYYLAAVPTSLVLAVVGVAFAHFVVLPAIFAYFTSYTVGTAVVAFGLKETFRLILLLMGYMALVFQIPLFMMLGIMMGLVDRRWYTEKRLLFWGGFLGLSFLVSPDPTGMAPIIIAATMIGLFEGTLLLLRWTNR